MPYVNLICHPNSDPHDRHVHVGVERSGADLSLAYSLDADLSHVRVPPTAFARRTDELWRHTCFEAFLAFSGGGGVQDAYYELNFAPSRAWASYRFDAYRQGMMEAGGDWVPEILTRRLPQQLQLSVHVNLSALAVALARGGVRLGLAAVIEDASGALSYWALRHPPGRADFHHPGGFVLELLP
jgi:hypothetical protein